MATLELEWEIRLNIVATRLSYKVVVGVYAFDISIIAAFSLPISTEYAYKLLYR